MRSDRSGPPVVDEHQAFMDLVAAYAMDAVDDIEEPAVELHLDACADCRLDLRRHHEILALLGGAAPATPPRSLWLGIDLARPPAPPSRRTAPVPGDGPVPIATPPTATPPTGTAPTGTRPTGIPTSGTSPDRTSPDRTSPDGTSSDGRAVRRAGRRPERRPALLLIAAVLAIVTGVFGALAVQQHQRADQLSRDLAGAPVDRAATQAQLEGRHRELELVSTDGRLEARILVDANGSGYFVPSTMSALPAGRAYQLWGISRDAGQSLPVSLGVLGPDPGTSAFHASASDTTYAITDEPAGGSQAPTTPVLASVTVT